MLRKKSLFRRVLVTIVTAPLLSNCSLYQSPDRKELESRGSQALLSQARVVVFCARLQLFCAEPQRHVDADSESALGTRFPQATDTHSPQEYLFFDGFLSYEDLPFEGESEGEEIPSVQ